MVLDYSKWDKLELSDDSDIEGHPNVDKASLIRWKQRDIHQKRQQRAFREKQLKVNIETNEDLLVRIDALIVAAKAGDDLKDTKKAIAISNKGHTKTKPSQSTSPEQPLYDDMIESLLEQISGTDPVKGLEQHKGMITGALTDEKKELAGIEFEKTQHITMEDLRDGWNSTTFNKKAEDSQKPAPESVKPVKSTQVETLNASKSTPSTPPAPSAPKSTPPNEEGLESLLDATKQFGELPMGNLQMSGSFLIAHPHIITEGQKDALIMTAFDAQLAGDSKKAANIVHQALLIQYSAILGGVDGARKFISRIADPKHPARVGFDQEVKTTTEHIQNRCRIISQENAQGDEEGVEQIQLHAVDPDTEIIVQVPDKNSEGYAIYESFPPEIKEAIKARSLDRINKVLGEMSVPEAEELVEKFSESGVLLVEDKIYDVEEWQKKKQELDLEEDFDGVEAQVSGADDRKIESVTSTIDELD